MAGRTDDRSRTETKIGAVTDSPAASSALRPVDEPPLTQESFQAVLSYTRRAGRWEPAEDIRVHAVCGAVLLDFTEAELPASGMIDIDARAICGSVEIVVPEAAEIELTGTPIMGSIEQVGSDIGAPDPLPAEAPYFRIEARAICGSVRVTAR